LNDWFSGNLIDRASYFMCLKISSLSLYFVYLHHPRSPQECPAVRTSPPHGAAMRQTRLPVAFPRVAAAATMIVAVEAVVVEVVAVEAVVAVVVAAVAAAAAAVVVAAAAAIAALQRLTSLRTGIFRRLRPRRACRYL
jgi:hypothetical protein